MSPNNVVAIRNIVASQKSFIAKIITKNNGVWHTNLATPNMLLGAWVPKVELDNLMVIINPLVGVGCVHRGADFVDQYEGLWRMNLVVGLPTLRI
jgi:hypothetical protein